MDEHRGLAGAGARQQQKRPLGGQNPLPLHGIQVFIFRGNGRRSRLYKSLFQFRHGDVLYKLWSCFHFNTKSCAGQHSLQKFAFLFYFSVDKNARSIYNDSINRTLVFRRSYHVSYNLYHHRSRRCLRIRQYHALCGAGAAAPVVLPTFPGTKPSG